MPYKTGLWGAQAKERSKKRNSYFNEYRTIRMHDLRMLVIGKYGSKCRKCGFDDYRALQLDHVLGGGEKERKKAFTDRIYKRALEDGSGKYQLLCANCNWIKRYENNELKRKVI